MFVIRETETSPSLYTIGHYTPSGEWEPYEDFIDKVFAEEKCAMLNGVKYPKPILHIELGDASMDVRDQFINSEAYEDLCEDYFPIVTTGDLKGIKISVMGIMDKSKVELVELEKEIKRIQNYGNSGK